MLEEYKKKAKIGIGLGILIEIIGITMASFMDRIPEEPRVIGIIFGLFGIIFLIGGIILYFWGFYCWANGKGYSGITGLILAIFHVFGLLVLALLPDKHKPYKPLDTYRKPLSVGGSYSCSRCGYTMSFPLDRCPNCRALLTGVKCENCGYIGDKSEFLRNNHRCPKCGSRVSMGGEGCFVATVIFNGYHCPEVMKLRHFRDYSLKKTRLGRKFIAFYYKNGPLWANAIKDKPLIKNFLKRVFKLFLPNWY